METKINIAQLKADLRTVVTEIKEVKAILREPHQPRKDWRTQGRLESLKRKATQLCSLRAHHRGKVHLRGKTYEEQAQVFAAIMEAYVVKDAAA
jgi:hypothetical protein